MKLRQDLGHVREVSWSKTERFRQLDLTAETLLSDVNLNIDFNRRSRVTHAFTSFVIESAVKVRSCTSESRDRAGS